MPVTSCGFVASGKAFIAGLKMQPLVTVLAGTLIATFVAGCATQPLAASPPKGIDLSGEWQFNANLSDDPQKALEEQRDQMREPGGHHGRRGGSPPFGMPGGGQHGGWGGAGNDGGGSGSNGPNGGPAGSGRSRGRDGGFGRLLEAPEHMTITQNDTRLVIKAGAPNGKATSEEYTAGEKKAVPFGRDTADCTVGWRGEAFVISMKAKEGPSKEDAYALDSDGRLIVTTQVSGGHMSKVEIKRVYDRVRAGRQS